MKPAIPTIAGGRIALRTAEEILVKYIENGNPRTVFLPPQRELVEEFGVSLSTVRRALAVIESRRLIRSEHGRGCRIMREPEQDAFKVAVLHSAHKVTAGRTFPFLEDAIHRQCLSRKWQVLSIDVEGMDTDAILKTLQDTKVDAVTMAFASEELFAVLQKSNIYCLAVETSVSGMPYDLVTQDDYGSAAQAARHLLDKGHTRIGWVGWIDNANALARFSGARSALVQRGLDFAPEDIIDPSDPKADLDAFLLNPERPLGLLSMWNHFTLDILVRVAKLNIWNDKIDLVGWGIDKQMPQIQSAAKKALVDMAAMVWSVEDMAETVASRLQLHRILSKTKVSYTLVPCKLVRFDLDI